MGRRPKFPKKDAEIIGNLTREEATELIFPKGSLDYIITTPKGYVVKAKWGDLRRRRLGIVGNPQKGGRKILETLTKKYKRLSAIN